MPPGDVGVALGPEVALRPALAGAALVGVLAAGCPALQFVALQGKAGVGHVLFLVLFALRWGYCIALRVTSKCRPTSGAHGFIARQATLHVAAPVPIGGLRAAVPHAVGMRGH